MNQRWRNRTDSYVVPGSVIAPREYEVAPIDEKRAKAFVLEHHYSGSYPSARFRFGLFLHGVLVGVAVFSHPMQDLVLTSVFPGNAMDSVELGRFVLLDEVPGNGETWFLARCFEQLKDKVRGVVSFSDPVPRTTAKGTLIFPGHIGTIYQAFNGVYLGRGSPNTLRLLPDGSVLSNRALSKIRKFDKGWEYSAEMLYEHGAGLLGKWDDPKWWCDYWLPRITRKFRHPGNHKYAWCLHKKSKKTFTPSLPYPKRGTP